MVDNHDILTLWERARRLEQAVFLATVVHVEGSSYRKPGARMLVTSGGERAGTISGGCLEAEISAKIAWFTADGSTLKVYRSSFEDDGGEAPSGLGCGGYSCNKRQPASGCSAIGGHNRMLAILGTSSHCIASNPSDQNVALAALEAVIHVSGVKGVRAIPIAEFYTLPGDTPQRETVLEPGDLITHVSLPSLPSGAGSLYLKLRDRASYEFALASAAIVLKMQGNRIEFVRVALGGVGSIPWRSREAEKALLGKAANPANFRTAAEAALHNARPQSQNGFKVELAKRCLVAALTRTVAKA